MAARGRPRVRAAYAVRHFLGVEGVVKVASLLSVALLPAGLYVATGGIVRLEGGVGRNGGDAFESGGASANQSAFSPDHMTLIHTRSTAETSLEWLRWCRREILGACEKMHTRES
jgi:hypothetical protein